MYLYHSVCMEVRRQLVDMVFSFHHVVRPGYQTQVVSHGASSFTHGAISAALCVGLIIYI